MILVIDDDRTHRKLYSDILKEEGLEVISASSADEAEQIISRKKPDMIVSDVKMPGRDGISFLKQIKAEYPEVKYLLITAFPDIRDAVNALKLGAVDYLEKPIDLEELKSAVVDSLHLNKKYKDFEVPDKFMEKIIAESPIMLSILKDAYKVAQSNATVLLTGESGTGKEVLASFIHKCSERADNNFVAVNCAAIPSGILAGELFGHAKGAYTGANDKRLGLFREADEGSLFLDEIGEMPVDLQPALLRAIESGNIMPLGSDKEQQVNFRLITATNRNLEEEVKEGRFRQDLFYRLNVIAFEIPPLRKRPEDILPLARYFISARQGKTKRFSPAATRVMQNYPWPGNARELSNAVERASILANTEVILPEHLPAQINEKSSLSSRDIDANEVKTMDQAEIEAIKSALGKTEGNRTRAAELLGISRRSLIYKIKRFNI